MNIPEKFNYCKNAKMQNANLYFYHMRAVFMQNQSQKCFLIYPALSVFFFKKLRNWSRNSRVLIHPPVNSGHVLHSRTKPCNQDLRIKTKIAIAPGGLVIPT